MFYCPERISKKKCTVCQTILPLCKSGHSKSVSKLSYQFCFFVDPKGVQIIDVKMLLLPPAISVLHLNEEIKCCTFGVKYRTGTRPSLFHAIKKRQISVKHNENYSVKHKGIPPNSPPPSYPTSSSSQLNTLQEMSLVGSDPP